MELFASVVRTEELTPVTRLHRPSGRSVASLIEDGAVLQCGIGGIPDAILPNLMDRRDLGVHTEMISDNVIPLIEAGVINGRAQEHEAAQDHPGLCAGTKRLFDFIDENPIFEFHPSAYTNDPFRIAMQRSHGGHQLSHRSRSYRPSLCRIHRAPVLQRLRGATRLHPRSRTVQDGKPIIALPSTAKDGTLSRIVPRLAHGAGVLTGRADVHYVVTEYGIAYLHGTTVRQRADALIQIAHPSFRDELSEYCEQQRWFQRNAAAEVRRYEE